MRGIVTDIQRFSIHDGPGIRTTVFLKGCNLRCFWCHNPETLRRKPEMQVFPQKCIGCGACVEACQTGARILDGGRRIYRRELCVACGSCARTCYAEAIVRVGRKVTVEEALAEVRRDSLFYKESGGGVTLSGGEPVMQADFAGELLAACKADGMHTAIETNLAYPWDRLAPILPFVDLVMFDIKALDSALHRRGAGSPNRRILNNAAKLGRLDMPLIARTPVIPGYSDSADEIAGIARFAAGLRNLLYYELLPFHPLGSGKWESLGMEYRAGCLSRPTRGTMRALAEAANAAGVRVVVAGERLHLSEGAGEDSA